MKLKYNKVATLAATLITFGSLAGGANAATISITIDTTNRTISGSGSFSMTTSTDPNGFDAKVEIGSWSPGASQFFPNEGALTATISGGFTANPNISIWDSGLFVLENLGSSTGETVTFQAPFTVDLTSSTYDGFWSNKI